MCFILTRLHDNWDKKLTTAVHQLGTKMASISAAHEPGISPLSIPLADALVPASIFAPDHGGGTDDIGDEYFEDEDMLNGESADRRVDFTSKVS